MILNTLNTANYNPTSKQKTKKRVGDKTGKEAATDVPSWAKGEAPYIGESGKDFAKRLCDEKYGQKNYETGPGSEYNKIKNGEIGDLDK